MSAVIGLSVLLLGVSGCSGSGSPSADPTSAHPGTAPGSQSASATPTQDPGQAAIAAVQRMFDAYNAMLKSGSSKAYRATFTKDCADCASSAESVEAVFGKGRSITGGSISISHLRVIGAYPDLKLVSVQGTVHQAASTVRKNGTVVDHYVPVTTSVVWNISEDPGDWLVSRSTDVS
jgi:hypothetical protein